ncbi:MAG: YiiX/YebB-like N1pC/P60 family cysteine hydrolase [Niabella sp.]
MKKRPKKPINISNPAKKISKLKKGWSWGYPFLLLLLISCNHQPIPPNYAMEFKQVNSVKPLVQNGDLIVRNGTDEISIATRKFNRRDTTYSHCGLIQIENDTVFVYHALGGRYNPSQHLMRQPIDSFCNPAEINKFAVFRYVLSATENNILTGVIQKHFMNKLPFDMYFNTQTNDKMYCSEFVYKSLATATGNNLMSTQHNKLPLYITIDDLYAIPQIRVIKKINF